MVFKVVVVDNTVVLVNTVVLGGVVVVVLVEGIVVVVVVLVVEMRSSGLTEKDIRKAPGQLPNSADVIPFLIEPFRKR